MGFLKPDPPDPPDYAEATREGILTDIETLPLRRLIDQASKAGTSATYTDPRTGLTTTADFSGIGDLDLSRMAVDFGIESADKIAKAQIDLEDKYGESVLKQRLKSLEMADPEGVAIRKKLGSTVLGDLERGSGLDPEMAAQVTEAERTGQAARGNLLGSSAGAAEGLAVGEAGQRMKQQRMANAAAFLNGSTPQAQFSSISGAQQGAVGFNPAGMTSGVQINPNAGAQGFAGNMQTWQADFQKSMYEFENSPWTQLFDTFNGMLVSAAGSAGGAMGG